MELGLEKKRIMHYSAVYCGSAVHEENTEMIVPDQSPDILRIIKGSANAFLKDKNARDGKLDVSGTVKGAVLYVAEGEKCVRKLDISMPFAYVIDGEGITANSKLCAEVHLRSLDVREINPRKVSVRAGVEISVCAYEESEHELCGGVSDCDKFGVCTRKSIISVYQPLKISNKSFSISDDVELSTVESDMSEIITCSVSLLPTDTKIIGNKSIVKGNANMNYIYSLPDGSLGCGEYELPFSQIIDIEGMNENNDLKISLSVSAFELEPQYDAAGKARYMTASIVADASVLVFAHEDIELVDDLYSTKYPLSVERKAVTCTKLHNRVEKRVAVTETVETGAGVKQVLDVNVNLSAPARRSEEGGEVLASDAVISVMYIGDDDGIYSATRRGSAVCPMPLNGSHIYEAGSEVRGKSFSIGANNEINVRFFTDFDITETEKIAVPAISAVDADTEAERSTDKVPSVIVKRLSSDCDIWSLAKEYGTTVEEIRLANDITEDIELSCGRMVLIPKKR